MLQHRPQPADSDHFELQLRQRLDPILIKARASTEIADWAPLARKNWIGDPLTGEFCRRFSGTGKADDSNWYAALERYAFLTPSEVGLLHASWRALRSQAMSVVKSAFSREEILLWAATSLEIVANEFTSAPPDSKRSLARQLAAHQWESDPHFNSFMKEFGTRKSWYQTLQRYFGFSNSERDLLEDAARDGAREKCSNTNRRHTLSDLLDWGKSTLGPLLEVARKTDSDLDWAELTPGRWSKNLNARAFIYAHSPHKDRSDMAGALDAVFGLTPEEIQKVRTVGNQVKGTVSSLRHRETILEPVERFKREELTHLVAQARASGPTEYLDNWDKLRAAHWNTHPDFRSFCLFYSAHRSPGAWADALTSAFNLEVLEHYMIRRVLPALAMVRASSMKTLVTPFREDTPDTTEMPEAAVLEKALREESARVIVPRPSSTILRSGKVLNRGGTKRPRSVAQEVRGRIASVVREQQSFDPLADEYRKIQQSLLPVHTTELGVRFLIQHAVNDPSFKWPETVLSAASGPGTLYDTFMRNQNLIEKHGLAFPVVLDLDKSPRMLEKSRNANRLPGIVERFPAGTGSVDAVECSSMNSFSEVTRALFLLEAGRRLQPGGLLWLKLDRAYFHGDFQQVLGAAGFEELLPSNTELLLAPAVQGAVKIPGGCYRARFAFATKQAEPDEGLMYSLLARGALAFERKPRHRR